MVAVLEIAFRILILIILSAIESQSQNLLINGGFEDCEGCPDAYGAIKLCANWTIPNYSTPDLYKKCDSLYFNDFDIPFNGAGHQEPFSGNVYAGFVLYFDSITYSEYIQGEMRQPLEKDMDYVITFYLSWAEFSDYYCDRIGYLFNSEKIIIEPRKGRRIKRNNDKSYSNDMLSTSNGFVKLNDETKTDRMSWHKVRFIYRAKGGEKYLILGLFDDNLKNEFIKLFVDNYYKSEPLIRGSIERMFRKKSDISKTSYYYIDEISVEKKEYAHH